MRRMKNTTLKLKYFQNVPSAISMDTLPIDATTKRSLKLLILIDQDPRKFGYLKT